MKNLFGSLEFGPISNENKVLALSPFGIAIRASKIDEEGNASYVTYKEGKITDINNLKMDLPSNPFYAIPTAELEVGDLIKVTVSSVNSAINNASKKFQYLYVEEVNEDGYKFLDPTTGTICNKVTIGNLLGISFHTKIVSLINFDGDSVDEVGGMNPMMMMMMMGGDNKDSGMSSMLPMMLMNQGNAPIDPMMMMMMTNQGGSNGGSSNMMEMMMMSQLIKGGNAGGTAAANPFGALFGGTKKKAIKAPVATAKKTRKTKPKAKAKRVAKKKTE